MLVAVLGGCAAVPDRASQPEQASPQAGTYHHDASGMQFPASIGPLDRRHLFHLDQDAHRVAAYYVLDDAKMPMEARVVVYPDPPRDTEHPGEPGTLSMMEVWRALGAAIRRDLDQPLVLADRAVSPPDPVPDTQGRYLLVLYNSGPESGLLLEDALYLYHRDGWNVQYRFTFPALADPTAEMQIMMRRIGVPRPAGDTEGR